MGNGNGTVVWFTGLSGSGKSTLATEVASRLSAHGWTTEVIDGDDLRRNLSAGLGFNRADREENVRRAGYLAGVLARQTDFVLVALIAPYRALRNEIASKLANYCEVFVNAPLAVCEARDPKGLYRRARAGQIRNFTGLEDPYEPPLTPEFECQTDKESKEQSAERLFRLLTERRSRNPKNWLDHLSSTLDATPGVTLGELAARFGVTTRGLALRLNRSAGTSFRDLRAQRLMAQARSLLETNCAVKDVAFRLGFSSSEAFSRFYRRHSGCTPKEFRNGWMHSDSPRRSGFEDG